MTTRAQAGLRVLTFTLMVIALTVVSPFSPDYGMDILHNEASLVDSVFTSSIGPLSTVDDFWTWTSGVFLGNGTGDSIVVHSSDGKNSLAFGRTLVGPIVFDVVRLCGCATPCWNQAV